MNKNRYFNLMMMLFLVIGLTLISCTKEGPAGPAGKDGANGKDANIQCGVCHSENATKVNIIFSQYELSKHNKGILYEEEAGRIACAACHTGYGFQEAIATGKDDATSMATGKISCNTCHTIHKSFDSTDFALRFSSPFQLRQTKANIDLKTGNLCSKCHQARAYTRTVPDTIRPASSTSTYSRFGPHYGTIANIVTMNGPVHIAGSVPYPTSNPHGNLAKGCVSCHMAGDPANPAVGGHSFLTPVANLATVAACTTCHDANIIRTAPKAKENATLLAEYRRILIDKGWLDTTQAVTAEGYQVLGEYFATPQKKLVVFNNPDDVAVVLNYLYVAKERSLGIHNPRYVQALLKNGLEYLKK